VDTALADTLLRVSAGLEAHLFDLVDM